MAPKPKPPPEPVEPPPPVGPSQEVHVILKVRLRLKPPAPEPPPQDPPPQPPPPPSPPPDATPVGGKGKPGKSPPKKPSTPASARKAAAAAAAAAAAEAAAAAAAAAAAKPVDPATLVCTVRYTPFAGAEQLAGPIKPVKPEPPVTPPPVVEDAAAASAPASASGGVSGAAAAVSLPYATVDVEHHAKVVIDEAAVRSLAASHGMLALTVALTTPPPEEGTPPAKASKPPAGGRSKAQLDVRPPTPVRHYSAVLLLDCSGMLVGEKAAKAVWPDKTKGLPHSMDEVAEGVEAEVVLLSLPKKEPRAVTPPAAVPKPRKSSATAADKNKKKEEPPLEPELKDLPEEPIGLMPQELVAQLNPIVVVVRKAKSLPAAPATRVQLDTSCAPPALFMRWPPGAAPREQPGLASPWQLPDGGRRGSAPSPWQAAAPSPRPSPRTGSAGAEGADGGGEASATAAAPPSPSLVLAGPAGAAISRVPPSAGSRYILFGQPEVFLAGDLPGGGEGALALCREAALLVEVHDRTAIPEPPEFPVVEAEGPEGTEEGAAGAVEGQVAAAGATAAGGAVAAAAGTAAAGAGGLPGSEGYVCGLARVSLLDLTRGYTQFRFSANLAPHTTVRGAASLDWTKRPGNYAEAGSVLKGEVQCALPLHATAGTDPSLRVFSRALFIMDYRDSDLFHLLEDTVRKNNAWKLGLKHPADKLPADLLPPELQARRKALEAGGDAAAAAVTSSPVLVPPAAAGGGSFSVPGPHRPSDEYSGGGARPMPQRQSRTSLSSAGSVPAALPRRSSSQYSMQDLAAGVLNTATRGSLAPDRSGVRSPGGGGPLPQRRESISPAPGAGGAGLGGGGGTGMMMLANNDSKRHVLFDSDSEEDDEPDEPPTAAELALDALCVDIDRVHLEMRELQALSTTQLTPAQASDRTLDLLTGWHLVDGRERVIVVEGLAEGAMKIVKGIADWALEEPKPEDTWRRRCVLFNSAPQLRTASRLYAPLGVDLWIVKLRAPLGKLLGEPGSFATGRVRPDCVQGLRRLGSLRSVAAWSRQAYDMSLWPSPQQLQLVDKKFGGELLAADVLGVEEAEPESDEEDGGPAMGALLEDARSAKSSRSKSSRRSSRSRRSGRSARSARSGRSGRSGKSGKGGKGGKGGRPNRSRRMMALETKNPEYLRLRREARAKRLGRDWVALNRESLRELEASTAHIKETWRSWNPALTAHQELLAALAAGTMTQEDLAALYMARRTQPEPFPGTLNRQDAASRSWYPHPSPFKWPAPRTRAEYRQIPGKPSEFRIQELLESWEESTVSPYGTSTAAASGGGGGGVHVSSDGSVAVREGGFVTAIRGDQTGLFGTEREYWKTVHSGQEEDLMAARRAEAEDWRRRLVVKDAVMRTTLPQRPPRPAQADRLAPLLQGDPVKKGFKVAHAPPAPINSQLAVPWTDPRAPPPPPQQRQQPGSTAAATNRGGRSPGRSGAGAGKAGDQAQMRQTGGSTGSSKAEFRHANAKPKTALHKLPYDQSWTASLHDSYYNQ